MSHIHTKIWFWAALVALAVGVFAPAMADTHDLTIGGTTAMSATYKGKVFLLERTLDFTASSVTGTAADVFQVINVPAGTWVLKVSYEIEAGATNTCTVDVGDGTDPDGYFNDASVETGDTAYAVADWAIGATAVVVTNSTLTTSSITLTNTSEHGASSVSVVTNAALVPRATTIYPVTTAPRPYANGKLYTAADTLDVTLNNATEELSLTIRALCVPIYGQ